MKTRAPSRVACIPTDARKYPEAPFHPDTLYPELARFSRYELCVSPTPNPVYAGVRSCLWKLGLDEENYGTAHWNPLRELIADNDRIVLKPNFVFHTHPMGDEGFEAMVTHASCVRPIIDYILLTGATGLRITICDVPLQSAIWEELIRKGGFTQLQAFYSSQGISIELLDLRTEITFANSEGVYSRRVHKERDPRGYTAVSLGARSYLEEIVEDRMKLEITDYGKGTVARHHEPGKHEYYIPNTILESNLFINIPKMKTHRKAGVSLSMKNLVGINGDKSWIAHHRRGVDEYPHFALGAWLRWYGSYYSKLYLPTWAVTILYKLHRLIFLKGASIKRHAMEEGGILMEGNWHGNDTIWRTVIDLNNLLFFANSSGVMSSHPARKYLTVIDGIVAMEAESPLEGLPKRVGYLVAGFHPCAADYVAASLMGFDWKKIPLLAEGIRERHWGLCGYAYQDLDVRGCPDWDSINLDFTPNNGWSGHIERAK